MSTDSTPTPQVRVSARRGLTDSVLSTRNLMTVAALAVVGLIVLIPLNYVSAALAATPGGILAGCGLIGLWVVPYLLPAAVVRRPGAATLASLIIGIVSVFTTPMGPASLVGNLIGGLLIEIPLALLLYRHWTWWSHLFAAAVFGLVNGVMYVQMLTVAVGVQLSAGFVVVAVASALAGGGATILLTRALHRAGVGIDHV